MSIYAWITVLVIAGTFLTLLLTKTRPETVFFTAMAVLCVSGVLNFEDTFKGFDSSSVLTVAVLYIVIAGLKYAGALEWIVTHIMGQPKTHLRALLRLMIPVGLMSSVMSNTACTALFQNVVKIWAKRLNISASKLLIPLAYAASMGGLLTLIGTPPNLIISSLYAQKTGQAMNILTPLPVGAAILVAGVLVVVLLRRFLPTREVAADDAESELARLQTKSNPRKVFISLSILVLMLILSATNTLPLETCCLGAGLLMVITRCCTGEQAYREVDWRVLIVFAGSVCIGKAIQTTGIDVLITNAVMKIAGNSPLAVLMVICGVAAVTTEFLSDTGCAAMFFPIAWSASQALQVSPMPFMLALMMCVSSSYATPIATPPNTIVYTAGGYRFADFARIGIPLKIVAYFISVFLTLAIYPF